VPPPAGCRYSDSRALTPAFRASSSPAVNKVAICRLKLMCSPVMNASPRVAEGCDVDRPSPWPADSVAAHTAALRRCQAGTGQPSASRCPSGQPAPAGERKGDANERGRHKRIATCRLGSGCCVPWNWSHRAIKWRPLSRASPPRRGGLVRP